MNARAVALAASIIGTATGCHGANPAYMASPAATPTDASPRAIADTPPDNPSDSAPDSLPHDSLPPDTAAAVPAIGCPGDPALAICLRFNGSITDESSVPVPLVVSGSVTYEMGLNKNDPTDKAIVTSATTDIGNSNIENIKSLIGGPLTIEAWIKPAELPGAGQRAGIIDYQPQWGMFLLPGTGPDKAATLRCQVSPMMLLDMPNIIERGVWSSVACTWGDSTLSLWHNGRQVAQRPLDMPTSGGGGIAIAGNFAAKDNPSKDPFMGALDNLRVWQRALPKEEICKNAHSYPSCLP